MKTVMAFTGVGLKQQQCQLA